MPDSFNQGGRDLASRLRDSLRNHAIDFIHSRTYISPFSPLTEKYKNPVGLEALFERFMDSECSDLTEKYKNKVGSEAFSKSSNRETRLLKAKQALRGFANGSTIAAMADTGSRKNVMSESYAKSMGFTIEDSRSTFEIGDSRKIQSTGRSRCRDPQRSSLS